jgi:tRNA nucleotidyltransferase/poly(A) polymerase
VNVLGTIYAAKAAYDQFARQNSGHIIAMSSVAGIRGGAGMSLYSATKAAQIAFIESLRTEFIGTGLHASVVFPASAPTEFRDVMRRDYGYAADGSGFVQVRGVGRGLGRALHRVAARRGLSTAACALAGPGRRDRAHLGGPVHAQARSAKERRSAGARVSGKTTDTREVLHAMATAVRARGGRALAVGGCVRDELLGRTPKDFDIEVFGVPADDLRTLLEAFGRVDLVGESFAVYKVAGLDVALPRRESKTGRGHKGFAIEGDPHLSIEDAARRRDFTINAISRDLLTNEIVDPFRGQDDLRARRLRVVDADRFGDDSLRVLRALQFTARFNLTVDAGTRAVLQSIPVDDLPAERVWGEIEKLLLLPDRPSVGFTLAHDLGLVTRLWPEMAALMGCPQEPEWHPEGDVWIHTLMVIDEARSRISDLTRGPAVAMMLGAICHDLGKPAVTAFSDGRIRIDRARRRRCGAGDEPARSLECAHARRLRRAARGAGPGRAPSQAEHVQEITDTGQRRRVSTPGAES